VFCRIRRFNEVLQRIERFTDVDWADVAASCGYFDQAHFNHNFRAFAALTPSAYLRDRISRTHVVVSGSVIVAVDQRATEAPRLAKGTPNPAGGGDETI
jgi:AraC-like DNA-binding protein